MLAIKNIKKFDSLNYLLSSSLKFMRRFPPYYAYKKDSFFQLFEPRMKEALLSSTISVLFDDGDLMICGGPKSIPYGKKIVSWCAVQLPDTYIFSYTRFHSMNKGHEDKVFNKIYGQLDMKKTGIGTTEHEILYMKFFIAKDFTWLNDLGSFKEPRFKVYLENEKSLGLTA